MQKKETLNHCSKTPRLAACLGSAAYGRRDWPQIIGSLAPNRWDQAFVRMAAFYAHSGEFRHEGDQQPLTNAEFEIDAFFRPDFTS